MSKSKRLTVNNTYTFLFALLLVAFFTITLNITVLKKDEDLQKEELSKAESCQAVSLSGLGLFEPEKVVAVYDGEEVNLPEILASLKVEKSKNILGAVTDERWIEIDLSEQKLIAWEGEKKFLETKVSSGLPWWPTPKGEFRIWSKFKYSSMEGGTGRYYYNLPNVPYVMFFENEDVPGFRGYGLHGTYWHNEFGTPRSHGCVNLPTEIAGQLFYWTTPNVSDGKWSSRSNKENPGTRIVIHE